MFWMFLAISDGARFLRVLGESASTTERQSDRLTFFGRLLAILFFWFESRFALLLFNKDFANDNASPEFNLDNWVGVKRLADIPES